MQQGGLGVWIRNYLLMGMLWCLIINVHAFVTGGHSALMAAAGPSTGTVKALEVAQILGRQVGLWPTDLWATVLRPIFG